MALCRRRHTPARPCLQIQEFEFAPTQPEGARRERTREQAVPGTPGRLGGTQGCSPFAQVKPQLSPPGRAHGFMLLCSGTWDTRSLKNLSPVSPGVRAAAHLRLHRGGRLPGSPRRARRAGRPATAQFCTPDARGRQCADAARRPGGAAEGGRAEGALPAELPPRARLRRGPPPSEGPPASLPPRVAPFGVAGSIPAHLRDLQQPVLRGRAEAARPGPPGADVLGCH